jgi:hypothetical protein
MISRYLAVKLWLPVLANSFGAGLKFVIGHTVYGSELKIPTFFYCRIRILKSTYFVNWTLIFEFLRKFFVYPR